MNIIILNSIELICLAEWSQLGEYCYQISSHHSYNNWLKAFKYCLKMNTSLAIIHNKKEFDFVQNLVLSTGKSVWIALKSNGQGMKWIAADQYQNHQYLNERDICMTASLNNGTTSWQLQNCLSTQNYYPLCVQGNVTCLHSN